MDVDRIEWDNSFLIGIEIIDRQHQKLFELANLFFEAMDMSKDKQLCRHILQGLMTYANVHFAAEEDQMRTMNYPQLDKHRARHQDLRHRVESLMASEAAGLPLDIADVAELLKQWLTQHIQNEDRQYGDFIQKQELVHNCKTETA
jgi:hemerythrin